MFKLLKNINLLIFGGFLVFGLAACSSEPIPSPIKVPQTQDEKLVLYTYLLKEKGIDVLKLGETRTVIIATDYLFVNGSANLDSEYKKNLDLVARLINSYDSTSVAVTVFSDQAGEVSQALTDKQAQQIVRYLWKRGVDTRLMFAKGYGNAYPVTQNENKNHFNRRVEIKFQFHPASRQI